MTESNIPPYSPIISHAEFNKAKERLTQRVLNREIHPQAAAQQFNELTLRALAAASPRDTPRITLVWMAERAVSFSDFCRAECYSDAPDPNDGPVTRPTPKKD